MASTPTRAEIEAFMTITGASESLARLKLQEHGGNLNEAVNAHFSEIDPYRTNSASVSSPRNDSFNANDQTQARQRGLLPILSAVRSFRPSLLLDHSYRRNLFNRPGAAPSPATPVPNIPRPAPTREMPLDFWSMNGLYDRSRTTANSENVNGSLSAHNPETHERFDNQVVEEEMIKAAIEASKQEVLVNTGVSHSQVHLEDDEFARALSLSMKTAEEEKIVREMQMKVDDIRQTVYQGAETSNRSGIEGLQTNPGTLLIQDRVDNAREHPLLAKNFNTQIHPQSQRGGPNSDEWGGLSSKELDEAVMLEAATFGQNSGSTSNFIPNAGHVSSDPHVVPSQPIHSPPLPSLRDHQLLREEQDLEYLASLLADQDKESAISKRAVTHFSKEENYKLLEKENLDRILARKEASLPMEPSPENQNAVTLLVRMPDGSRHGRRFLTSDKLQSLYDFIDVCRVVKPGSYRVVRSFPRRAFSPSEGASTFSEVGLTSKQEVLFLELISSELHE